MKFNQYPEYTVSNNSTMSSSCCRICRQTKPESVMIPHSVARPVTASTAELLFPGITDAASSLPNGDQMIPTSVTMKLCRYCAFSLHLMNTDEDFVAGVTHFKSILPEFFRKDIPIISDCEEACLGLDQPPSEYSEDLHLCYAIQITSAFNAIRKFRETNEYLTDCVAPLYNCDDVVKFSGRVLRQKLNDQFVAREGRIQPGFRPCFYLMPDGEVSATVNIVPCPNSPATDLIQFQFNIATKPVENGKIGIECVQRSICLDAMVVTPINAKALHPEDKVWFPYRGNEYNPKGMEFKDYRDILNQNKKQKQREEQREQDRKRREEEIALRSARAALVTAVAKIDADLERIKHLKELNKEIAIKNQKIADRKEAEKLALAAEQRHAEKLKQKEAERQKFLSKKN